MAKKNHINKKNNLRQEQYIQSKLNFLIENTFKIFNVPKFFSINIVEDVIDDVMRSMYLYNLYENNCKPLNINTISNSNNYDCFLVSLKTGQSFTGHFKGEPNYVHFRKINTKRPKTKNFVNFCKICQINLNTVETILEEKILEII